MSGERGGGALLAARFTGEGGGEYRYILMWVWAGGLGGGVGGEGTPATWYLRVTGGFRMGL